jgi:hypothetical protein
MDPIAALNRLEKRYAWSFSGFVLAAAFGALTIYTEFIRVQKPVVQMDVLSDAAVLSVQEPLTDLQVVYEGTDIRKTKQTLRVIVFKVSNTGTDVLRGYYDESVPFGFKVDTGTLLRAEVLDSSNQYLRNELHVALASPNRGTLTPVILESGEWFTIKTLVIHPEEARPVLRASGKIAGVREIQVHPPESTAPEPSYWRKAFGGGLLVQLGRGPVYFLGIIIVLIAVIAPIVGVSSWFAKRRRKRHVGEFKALYQERLLPSFEHVFDAYVENGVSILLQVHNTMKNASSLELMISSSARSRHRRTQTKGSAPSVLWRDAELVVDGGLVENVANPAGESPRWRANEKGASLFADFLHFVEVKDPEAFAVASFSPRLTYDIDGGGPTL